ncbi:MAG: hybrid sensor histidine kinase/response regulator, partial [Halocynthiibacter sp.]
MSQPADMLQPFPRTSSGVSARPFVLVVFAVTLLGAGLFVPDPVFTVVALSAGASLVALSLMIKVRAVRVERAGASFSRQIAGLVGHDGSPCFVTDKDGRISYQNRIAAERFELGPDQTLAHTFRDLFANPSAVFFRLQNRSQALGAAREDVVTRRGYTRLSVHRVAEDAFLWRIDDFGERAAINRGAEGLSLPMLTASKSGTVLFMNEAMRRVLGERVKTLDRVFNELPVRPGAENEIVGKDGPLKSLVAEIEGAGGRREIYLIPGQAKPERAGTGPMPIFDELPVPLLKIAAGGRV